MEKIIGIGTDIEEIAKFRELLRKKERKRFLERVYTRDEIDYCLKKIDPAQHLAVRFCAKEATVKALGGFSKKILPYNQIEIRKDRKEIPVVRILHKNFSGVKVKISLSHTRDIAIALALAIRK